VGRIAEAADGAHPELRAVLPVEVGEPGRPAMSAGGGVDLETVRERLGHGSIVTTGKYLHALPGADQAAVRAYEAYRG
jgi:hypothetical protein